jgi:4-amino-4-deoxychorismate lyase
LPLLLETLYANNGSIRNLSYHQRRLNTARQHLFGSTEPIDLAPLLCPPMQGCFRCRILYDSHIHTIEYLPYTPKEIRSIAIVNASLSYDFKYANRDALNALKASHSDVDEILIAKEGYLTDTTIANIALYQEGIWYTPSTPLLKGCMRQYLLDHNKIQPRPIKASHIHHYSKIALLNAMVGFRVLEGVEILTIPLL